MREIKGLKFIQRFRGAHGKDKVAKADRRMRVIAWRFVRELLRKLLAENKFRERLGLCLKLVTSKKVDGHKTCSLYEPDVFCISKGKEHKRYEFGNKVSIGQVGRIYGVRICVLAGDRGHRGSICLETQKSAHPTCRRPPTRRTPGRRSTGCSASGLE